MRLLLILLLVSTQAFSMTVADRLKEAELLNRDFYDRSNPLSFRLYSRALALSLMDSVRCEQMPLSEAKLACYEAVQRKENESFYDKMAREDLKLLQEQTRK